MEVDESSADKQGLMTTLHNLFSTTNPSVKKLMGWRQGDEEEKWAERAIESLVKRLKKKRGALEELERAVSNPQCPSKCVTIARSLDGRIQVSHRKGHPHVMYCKLWRWPDLQSHHELRPMDYCRYPFSARHNEICVNPYHYQRVENPKPPAVMVPKGRPMMGTRATFPSPAATYMAPLENNRVMVHNVTLCTLDNSYSKPEFTPEPMIYCDSTTNSLNYTNTLNYTNSLNCTNSVNYANSNINESMYSQDMQNMYSQDMQITYSQDMQNMYTQDMQNTYSQDMQTTYSQDMQNTYSQDMQITYSQDMQNTYSQDTQNTCSQDMQNMYSQNIQNTCSQNIQNTCSQDMQNTCSQDMQNTCSQDMQNTTAIPYEEPSFWASIAYYELNSRVGEIFNCAQTVITVDGFTDPTQEAGRFCLGTISNVNRNSTIENTRRHIGRGVQLHYAAGQVYAECISEQAIFIQSRNCNYEGGLPPTTVIKLPPGSVFKIFDNMLFSNILSKTVHYGYEAVYELTKMCTIRMSFVKGWGAEYHRHDVTATPCWIEIHLNGALRWLDNVLTGMGAPHHAISSMT